MGRSVNYLNNANKVCYEDVSWMNMRKQCPECSSQTDYEDTLCDNCGTNVEAIKAEYDEYTDDWEWWSESILEQFTTNFPELEPCDKWEGNEVHILLESDHVRIATSEYCNLASVSLVTKEAYYNLTDEEADEYDKYAEEQAEVIGLWMDKNIGDLRAIGAFSDGTSVYEVKTND